MTPATNPTNEPSRARTRATTPDDRAVSPVIAVILMVAITVVLAATVYLWVSDFATDQDGPEQASATAAGLDASGDGQVDWIRLTLTSGTNAPYNASHVRTHTTLPNGATTTQLCANATLDGSACANPFNESWATGSSLFIPCEDPGSHTLTITVRETAILDTRVNCDQAAQ